MNKLLNKIAVLLFTWLWSFVFSIGFILSLIGSEVFLMLEKKKKGGFWEKLTDLKDETTDLVVKKSESIHPSIF